MAALSNLPVELVHAIHLHALNPSLAATSHHFRSVLLTTSSTERARWLIAYAFTFRSKSRQFASSVRPDWPVHWRVQAEFIWVLTESLKHPICDLDVLRALKRIYHARLDAAHTSTRPPPRMGSESELSYIARLLELPRWPFSDICICPQPLQGPTTGSTTGLATDSNNAKCAATPAGLGPGVTVAPHDLTTLLPLHTRPRKSRTEGEVLALLDTLDSLAQYTPPPPTASHDTPADPSSCTSTSPSSPRTYTLFTTLLTSPSPLILSCVFGAKRLVAGLLKRGADPSLKDGLAVRAAIQRKDLELVKMLIERRPETTIIYSSSSSSKSGAAVDDGDEGRKQGSARLTAHASGKPGTTKAKDAGGGKVQRTSSAKRRRLLDRVVITPQFLEEAMRLNARDIVDWFVEEKGVSPDIKTLGKTLFRSSS